MKQVKSVMLLAVGLLVGFFTGALVTGGYSAITSFNYSQPVCQVGDTIITRGQLAEATILQSGMSVLETDMKYRAYVEEEARINKITVTPEEVKLRVDEYKNLVGQFDQLADILGSKSILDSIPQEMLDEETRFTMLAEKVMKVSISEAEMTEWYVNNPKIFFRPRMVKLTAIITKDYASAKSAWNSLEKNDPLEKAQMISVKYSTDENLRKVKGDVGWWTKETMQVKTFSDAIFNARNGQGLKAGQYTDPLPYTDRTTGNSDFRVFYVEEIKDEWVPAIAEIRPALRFLTRMDKIRAAQPKWLETTQKMLPWKRVTNLRDPNGKVVLMELP